MFVYHKIEFIFRNLLYFQFFLDKDFLNLLKLTKMKFCEYCKYFKKKNYFSNAENYFVFFQLKSNWCVSCKFKQIKFNAIGIFSYLYKNGHCTHIKCVDLLQILNFSKFSIFFDVAARSANF